MITENYPGMSYTVRRFTETERLVGAAATEWVHRIRQNLLGDRPYLVALGGGRVFGDFLIAATAQFQSLAVSPRNIEFFWGDERCVPPDHPESNYRLAETALLRPLGVAASRIHRLRGEIVPDEAAAAAAAVLRRAAGVGSTELPNLDLIFLGMGEDGHVASLFPDAPAEASKSPVVYLPVIGPKPPPQRLTLSYAAIAAAKEVWVIASGSGKQSALHESFRKDGNTPLGRVLRGRVHTTIFTDIPQ